MNTAAYLTRLTMIVATLAAAVDKEGRAGSERHRWQRLAACGSAACGACSSMAWKVHRKATMLIAISDSVMIGHRRADIFSCPIGISMAGTLFFRKLGTLPDVSKSLSRLFVVLLNIKGLQSTEVIFAYKRNYSCRSSTYKEAALGSIRWILAFISTALGTFDELVDAAAKDEASGLLHLMLLSRDLFRS